MNRLRIIHALFFLMALLPGAVQAQGTGLTPPLRLKLHNETTQAWSGKPVTSGVMLPRGAVHTTASLMLTDGAGANVPAQFLPTALWPDHSLKWVLLDLRADLAAGAVRTFFLRSGTPPAVAPALTLSRTAASIQVVVAGQAFVFNTGEFRILGREFLIVKNGLTYRAVPFAAPQPDAFPSPSLPWSVEESGPLKIVLKSEGAFQNTANPAQSPAPYIRYRARLYFYAGQPWVMVYLTLQNNQSFGWPVGSLAAGTPDENFSAIRFGSLNLVPGTTNLFGAGIEKTWQVQMAAPAGTVQPIVVQVDPAHPTATRRAEPLLAQDPADVARIGGFGDIVPPLVSTSATLNAVLSRFEKTLRALVVPEDTERLANESPAGTVFDHMAAQLGNDKDYGCLLWADGWSRNHYDWIYGLDLGWLRTGESRFVDGATIMARHQADLDIYHTWINGPYFNFMTNWEGAGGGGNSHNNAWAEQGNGRPTHTWNQGLMLHWLLTGDRRSRDAAYELLEGARQYLYLAQNGAIPDREIRLQGWISEVFMTGWLVDPFATLDTGEAGSGPATYRDAVLTALQPILDLERADGSHGYVHLEDDPTQFQPLQLCYAVEPLIKAYERLLKGTGDPREAQYRALIFRIVDLFRARFFFGDTTAAGYRPLQIAYYEPVIKPATPPTVDNELPYTIMAGNAAAYVYSQRHDAATLKFARQCFRDYVYYREAGSGNPVPLETRAPTGYLSLTFMETESKIHGWSGRYGQYYLKMEKELGATPQAVWQAGIKDAAWLKVE